MGSEKPTKLTDLGDKPLTNRIRVYYWQVGIRLSYKCVTINLVPECGPDVI